ncbi:hypothetical protein [Streptomyces sp. NPDC048606]|uniref:barstar family protein n=1 Tax=Streptomyces sp. NPDC048606 TaxID=3154726 RepID=UPI003416FB87
MTATDPTDPTDPMDPMDPTDPVNPWKTRWTWEREIPLRFVVVEERETPEGDPGELRVLAKCTAVEGLFAEPPVPPREELVLFGCAPEGALLAAIEGANGGRAGDLCLDVSLGGERVWGWSYLLHDVVVTDFQRDPKDPARFDVAVEVGVEAPEWSFGRPSASRQEQMTYVLYDASDRRQEPNGTCEAVPGLFAGGPDRRGIPEDSHVLRLLGCEVDDRALWEWSARGRVEILAVDRTGRVLTGRYLSVHVMEEEPCDRGDGLRDVTAIGRIKERPVPEVEALWRLWEEGRPTTPGLWREFPDALHGEWLDLAVPEPDGPRTGDARHLDGAAVTGHHALYCALGEAVNGPGGSYGRCWNSLFDALSGCYEACPTPPFTLVWHDFEASRLALADAGNTPDVSYAEEVVGRLRDFGVTVELR